MCESLTDLKFSLVVCVSSYQRSRGIKGSQEVNDESTADVELTWRGIDVSKTDFN